MIMINFFSLFRNKTHTPIPDHFESIQALLRRLCSDPKAIICIALGIGLATRLSLVAPRTFPINDGGFWCLAAQRLIENNFALPTSISFNGQNIPFAYPPLGVYLLAFISYITGVNTISLTLWLPLGLNLITILVFSLFALRFFGPTSEFVIASLLFPLFPQSYQWFVMGGGVTRGLGFIALLLCWRACLYASNTHYSMKNSLAVGVFLAAAVLSHPSAGLWSIFGIIIFLSTGLRRFHLWQMIRPGLIAITLLSPWVVLMLARYGISPFIHAFGSGEQMNYGMLLEWSHNWGLAPVSSGLILIGITATIKNHRPQLVMFFMLGLVLDIIGLIPTFG